jgi:ribosome biogenesis protein BMS1
MEDQEKPEFRLETEQDLTDNLDPPFVIVVQGSRESGKSTVIQSLVYHFTKQKINDVKGTITLRTNKNMRITLYECPTDMQAMIDLAKITDLALILIDASIGFEMESFEFLSLLQNHGMPNVMGILTHLDYFRENKALRKIKKRMKKRFWKEVYDGAKLFYFSGQQKDGLYPKTEVHNLARFITVQKIKPLSWKINHSYVVADRLDMIETQQADDKYNTISVYGYVRGTYLDKHQRVHLNGLGDFDIKNITKVEDPCPIELKKTVKQKQAEHEAEKQGLIKKKKRNLKDKERVLYAPYTNIGNVNFESTTGYINIPDQNVVYTRLDDNDEGGIGEGLGGIDASNTKDLNEGQKMVFNLQDAEKNNKFINDQEIMEPQLLAGIDLNSGQIEKSGLVKEITEKVQSSNGPWNEATD